MCTQPLKKILDIVEDEEDLEFMQNALDNLEFTEGANALNMFDVSPKDLEDLDEDLFLDDIDDSDQDGDLPLKPSVN